MPLLTLTLAAGFAYSVCLLVISGVARLRGARNAAFSRSWPEIDFPLWRVALQHIVGLASTVLWLLRWPSITEVWCSMALVPLLLIPFPTIMNNVLEECMAFVMGNARHGPGEGSLRESWEAVRCWFKVMLAPPPPQGRGGQGLPINHNHSLLCYAQNESTAGMHHLDADVLHSFPTPDPSSRANAVMMARCATMSYDRWHNIDQAVRNQWSSAAASSTAGKKSSAADASYRLVTAWSFDRVSITSKLEKNERCGANESTAINTDAFLLQRKNTVPAAAGTSKAVAEEVALVLAFRGTEALQTIDWISDLAHVQPPTNARDRTIYPKGFTHQGFRDALGLKRNLAAADGSLAGFANSYLQYAPDPVDASLGTLARQPSTTDAPFTIITDKIRQVIEAELESNPDARVKLFVTGHSLGGALAHLFAGTLLLREEPDLPAAHFEAVFTFGQPRVGGQRWVQAVDEALRNLPGTRTAAQRYIRLVNTCDIVTRIPPPLGEEYQHSGHLVYIKPHFAILGASRTQQLAPAPAAAEAAAAADPSSDTVAFVNLAPTDAAAANPAGVAAGKPAAEQDDAEPDIKQLPDQNDKHSPLPAAADQPQPAGPNDDARSPIRHLIETPDMFLQTTAACALAKLGLSVVLLLASWWPSGLATTVAVVLAVAAAAAAATAAPLLLPVAALAVGALSLLAVTIFVLYTLWPELWNETLGPVAAELQVAASQLSLAVTQPGGRPVLFRNIVYPCTRLLALLGPVPVLAACDVVLFACVPVLTWPALFVEPLLLLALLVFMPPVIFCGLIDHSMAEYYTAAFLTCDSDWTTL